MVQLLYLHHNIVFTPLILSGKRISGDVFPERAIFPYIENMALSNINDINIQNIKFLFF